MFFKTLISVIMLFALSMPLIAKDDRQLADLPDHINRHLISSMRDHLLALEEITRHLSNYNYGKAADVAEKRLGMSSVEIHYTRYLGKYMPKEMSSIATKMHRAASRFALSAKNAEHDGGLNRAFAALSEVMEQCVACHTTFRIH